MVSKLNFVLFMILFVLLQTNFLLCNDQDTGSEVESSPSYSECYFIVYGNALFYLEI